MADIVELDLVDARSVPVLRSLGINDTEDLKYRKSWEKIYKAKNCGDKTFFEIVSAFADYLGKQK